MNLDGTFIQTLRAEGYIDYRVYSWLARAGIYHRYQIVKFLFKNEPEHIHMIGPKSRKMLLNGYNRYLAERSNLDE